jgi:hypothetical protein
MWARRLVIGSGFALASLVVVPSVAGAADPGCYTSCAPPAIAATTGDGGAVLPAASSGSGKTGSTSSLPFTGADVEELAVVGVGAVLAGGILIRRRRAQA